MPASKINSSQINKYIEKRLEEGAANGTVNRELSALKSMLNLGARSNPPKVAQVPYVPKLKENNVRKGFLDYADFLVVKEHLPDYLKGFATFAYRTGWRKSEIIGLTWAQVDRTNGIINLNPGETKNDEARTLYLDGELMEIIEHQRRLRKESGILTPNVFTNKAGNGPVGDIRKSWKNACEAIGRPELILHDLRRSSIRNMVRAGIPERVAMQMSGHKTREIFERYNIVSPEDLKMAAARQEAYLKSQTVTTTVTIGKKEAK